MKAYYLTLIALFSLSFLAPQNLTAQEDSGDDWEFFGQFDDTEDVSPADIDKKTILMPNPLISGTSLEILMPTDMDVHPGDVKVYDVKGSLVSAPVSKDQRRIFVATQRLGRGVYFVELTQKIRKKFVIQ